MSEMINNEKETYFGIDSLILGFWLSIIGLILGLLLTLAPITQFIKILKKQESYKIIPEKVLIFNTICAVSWFVNWNRLGYSIPYLSAGINTIISLLLCGIYLYFYAGEKILNFIVAAFIYYDLVFQYYYLCKYNFSIKTVGNLAMIINIIQFFSPFSNILFVMKTGNIKLISLNSSLIGSFCSLIWFFYGLIIKNFNLMIPNGIGFFLSIIQIIIYYYFYWKFGGKIIENDEKKEELNENDEKMEELNENI